MGQKKLTVGAMKKYNLHSPFISYSTCHREPQASNSTPGYLHPVTSRVLNPLPLPTSTGSPTTSNTDVINLLSCSLLCNVLHCIGHFITSSTGGTNAEGKRHQTRMLCTKNYWLGEITLPLTFLPSFWLYTHLLCPQKNFTVATINVKGV